MKKSCWQVSYYFRRKGWKKLLKGIVCGCIPANTQEQAKAIITQADMGNNETLIKVVARKPSPNHHCFSQEDET